MCWQGLRAVVNVLCTFVFWFDVVKAKKTLFALPCYTALACNLTSAHAAGSRDTLAMAIVTFYLLGHAVLETR